MATKSNHTGLGIAVGAVLGALAGVLVGHIAIWLGIGIAIGMLLGATLRRSQPTCPECAAIHRSHRRREEETKLQQLSN
jgi:uncharacterized membrane protein YoaK (UPF0700 family)